MSSSKFSHESRPQRELQESVWGNVERALRRRRRNRVLVRIGAAGAIYALGIASAPLLFAEPASQPTATATREAAPAGAAPVQPAAQPSPPAMAHAESPAPAHVLLKRDDRPGWQRARDYGDKFLRETDIAAATRQYRRYLDGAVENGIDLAPAPDDTWLLHALKRARTEERSNA